MAIRKYKPTTPARRHMTVSKFEGIDKKAKPERSLTEVLNKKGVATTMVVSPFATEAAARRSTVSSTSSVIRKVRQPSCVWKTSGPAAPTSH